MRRRYKFLRKMYRTRRVYKEFPHGNMSNDYLIERIKDEIEKGSDFIIQF